MKIALIHYAAPPVVGGVETVLAHQAEQLANAGHQVFILAGRGETWDARIPVVLLPRLDSRHPNILKIKASLDCGQIPDEFDKLVSQIQGDLRLSLEGAQAVILHNVASLNKNLALTAALYNLSRSFNATRFILWHHDLAWTTSRYRDELHPGWPWDLLRTAWPGVKQVVVSEARRKELAELMNLPAEQITIIPAGLNLTTFCGLHPRTLTLVKELHLLQAAPILLTPVRVTRRKNIELALEVLVVLRKEMPNAVLVVTGPPGAHNPANLEYLESLKNLRSELKLKGAAFFLAERNPDGLPESSVTDLYRLADALFIPSKEEGFGIPLLESGLARLPIFCTNLASLQALAGDCANYFSLDDSPAEIASLVASHLKASQVYQMEVRVRMEYTWEAIYRRHIAPLLEQP
jgi:glycosyltransferase involved in cell wall biosynthesis